MYDPLLSTLSDMLDDLQATRTANENRLRELTRSAEDRDGKVRGFGLRDDHSSVVQITALVTALVKMERAAVLELQRCLRKHPLGPWVKATKGVGEKQGARLLAAVGDPYWNDLHERPRTVSELWAYCGYHVLDGKAPARARGAKANWSATAKMRAYLVAESCMKQRESPYRVVYDDARAHDEGALHPNECKRCGPAGRPAQVGSPLSKGHAHARAMRKVSKAVLRDLWRESKRLHEMLDLAHPVP